MLICSVLFFSEKQIQEDKEKILECKNELQRAKQIRRHRQGTTVGSVLLLKYLCLQYAKFWKQMFFKKHGYWQKIEFVGMHCQGIIVLCVSTMRCEFPPCQV